MPRKNSLAALLLVVIVVVLPLTAIFSVIIHPLADQVTDTGDWRDPDDPQEVQTGQRVIMDITDHYTLIISLGIGLTVIIKSREVANG